jgi:hypothetical protein
VLKTNHVDLLCAHLEILEDLSMEQHKHYWVNKDILCKRSIWVFKNFKGYCKQKSICESIYANIEMPGAKYKLNLINHRHETNSLSPEEATREDWLLHQLIIYLK